MSITETSPVYGADIATNTDASTNDEIKSPEADIDTRHMPGTSVAIPKEKSTSIIPTTNVDSFNACNIVE